MQSFVCEFLLNFCYYGNKDLGNIWMTTKNPSPMQAYGTSQVIANFTWKFPHFCYHGNKGLSRVNLNNPIKFADPENPIQCNNLQHIITRIIGHFVSKSQISINLPWQQQSVWDKFDWTIKLANPENPIWCKNLDHITYKCTKLQFIHTLTVTWKHSMPICWGTVF